ncbi:iron-containing redox enzyme family protein [Gluconacetobacter diazotrophicus]|nr:iron-containing redox enzyme family protein [Gluconacetobacter diazotrophicus]MBB2156541.1 iron-containing redox enzyme family protein [Gluconacetobacter diazotrophicus]
MPTHSAGVADVRSPIHLAPNAAKTFHDLSSLALERDDADRWLAEGPRADDLRHAARQVCALAFSGDHPDARRDVHHVLHRLYDLHLARPVPGMTRNQESVELLRLRKQIEQAWQAWEHNRIGDVPENLTPDAIGGAIKAMWRQHAGHNHPVFEFMRTEADRAQIIKYFTTDYALNMRFYDLIVLSLLGIDEDVRMEVAGNFWDEMGQGNAARTHVRLYRDLLDYLGIEDNPAAFVDALGWEGLGGYNLLLYFALNRREYFRSIGALAITELSDPDQYAKLIEGCRRVGIGTDRPSVLDYYSEHVEVDALHGDGWIDNVIVPVLRRYPDQARAVLEGAAMRLNTSKDYWDWQLAEMRLLGKSAPDAVATL